MWTSLQTSLVGASNRSLRRRHPSFSCCDGPCWVPTCVSERQRTNRKNQNHGVPRRDDDHKSRSSKDRSRAVRVVVVNVVVVNILLFHSRPDVPPDFQNRSYW